MSKSNPPKTKNERKNEVIKMKKLWNKIKDKANELAIRTRTAVDNAKAEGYVDSGVKILIAVVIGALLLAGLYALFNTTIMPTVTQKVKDLFNYHA